MYRRNGVSPAADTTVSLNNLASRPTVLLAGRELSAGYGGIPVIEGLNCEVGAGEVVALLGANGAGKTTLVSTLAGVIRPLAGAVWWEGAPYQSPLHVRVR